MKIEKYQSCLVLLLCNREKCKFWIHTLSWLETQKWISDLNPLSLRGQNHCGLQCGLQSQWIEVPHSSRCPTLPYFSMNIFCEAWSISFYKINKKHVVCLSVKFSIDRFTKSWSVWRQAKISFWYILQLDDGLCEELCSKFQDYMSH